MAGNVPKAVGFGGVAGFGAVIINNDVKADRSGVIDDVGQDVASVFAFAGWTETDEMVRGDGIALPHLIRIRQADGAEAVCLDFVKDEGIVLSPEAAGSVCRGFGAIPVHAAHDVGSTRGIVNLRAAGMPAGGVERRR